MGCGSVRERVNLPIEALFTGQLVCQALAQVLELGCFPYFGGGLVFIAAVWLSHHLSSHFRGGRGDGRGHGQVVPAEAALDHS